MNWRYNNTPYDIFNYEVVEEFTSTPWQSDPAGQLPTARLRLIPWRNQDHLEEANVLFVGAGAGSQVAGAMARSGMRRATIMDDDLCEVTNTSRQLIYPGDLGRPKAHSVAANVAAEAVNGGRFIGVAMPFPDGLDYVADETYDLVLCLVDDQTCRIEVSRWARARGIHAVIAGFGTDAHSGYSFLQRPGQDDACLACAFPDIRAGRAPCGPATIKTVYLVGAIMLHFADIALCGVPEWAEQTNERLVDLWGRLDGSRLVTRDPQCWLCGKR